MFFFLFFLNLSLGQWFPCQFPLLLLVLAGSSFPPDLICFPPLCFLPVSLCPQEFWSEVQPPVVRGVGVCDFDALHRRRRRHRVYGRVLHRP